MIEPLLQAERLFLHGLIDQAEALYRSTLEADPRNAIALVGLARVSLERSDEAGAYGQVCQALEIDPQNAVALRLEARLAEILLARGEPVERPAWLSAGGGAGPLRQRAPIAAARDQPPDGSPSADPVDRSASEGAAFARNRSMADHQKMDAQRRSPSARPEPQPDSAAEPSRPRRKRRPRGLLRRLLGQ
jgi:hypothetical protein